MDQVNLEKMLEQGTDNALLRYTLGTLFLKQKAYAQAEEHLSKAVVLDPHHSASWKQLGKALTGMQRPAEAVESYQRGIEVAEAKGDVQAAKEMRVFLNRLSKA